MTPIGSSGIDLAPTAPSSGGSSSPPAEARPEPAPFPGQTLDLGANRPFLLEARKAWYLERGEVDIFSVRLSQGAVIGNRRHLLRVRAGQLLLGIAPPSLEPQPRGFMAVATNGSRLVAASTSVLGAMLEDARNSERVRALIGGWIESLSRAIASGHPAKAPISLLPGPGLDFKARTVAVPAQPGTWIRPLSGRSHLLGKEELPLPDDEYTPLAPPAWVAIQPSSRLEVCDTAALPDGLALWSGLEELGRLVTRYADLLAREEEQAALARSQRLLASQGLTIQRACARLASALQPRNALLATASQGAPDDAGGGPLGTLVQACRRVGAELGVAIKPPPDPDGTRTARDPFAAIMQSSRLRARKVALRGQWWRVDHGPLVAFLADSKRPVALIRSRRRYRLHDDSETAPKTIDAATAVTLSPFAYMIYRPFPETPLTIRDLIRFAFRGCAGDLGMIVLMGAAVTVLGMVPAFATSTLFNSVIPGARRSQLWQITMLLIICALSNVGFTVARGIALLRLQQRVGTGVQAAVWDRLMRLPLTFFRPYTAGDLATRAMAIDGIQQILSSATLTAILSGAFTLGNIALMFTYSPVMAWHALILLAVAAAVTAVGGVIQRAPERTMLKLRARTSGLVLQLLSSISKLRVAGAEARAFSQWVDRFAQQRALQYKVRSISNWLNAFNSAFPVLASILIFMAGLPLLSGEGPPALRTGDFLAFGAAFAACLGALLGACQSVLGSLSAFALYQQARPILDATPEAHTGQSDPGVLSGEIEVQHAVFRYASDGPPILRDLSLHIRPGEFVAFVGPSGSGKSTLLKLLLRFETLESGSIFYDGQDLGGLDIQEVRRQIGVVLQNGRLIAGDIFRNIAGDGNATQEEVWEAARMAGIADDIKAMPMQMHTVISEGASTLSGGQRQRLMIARAIVNRPRLLLFDEATSALDNRTQAIVTSSLEQLKATRIVVAHRLSTIANADRIYVIERGRLVQQGTFSQLIKEKGTFAELARRQLV